MTKKLSDAEYLRSIDHRFNVVEFKRLHEIAAELERLSQERHQLRNELTAAGLENERLRKALQDVTCVATPELLNGDEEALATMRGIAGEALSGSPSEPSASETPALDWQPIGAAPKGGAWVLLWWPTITDCAIVGYHSPYGWHSAVGGGYESGDKYGHPTHWMPLPKPPSEKSEGGQ